MPARLLTVILTCLLSLGGAYAPAQARGDTPLVAAASVLQFALSDIAAAFEAQTGQQVRLSFGSTGNISRQIREGAPYEVFLAADEAYILDLAADAVTPDAGDIYAHGRLVLIAPHGSVLSVDPEMNGLQDALEQGRITRFAIANPEHAPYGQRAREALMHRQLWEALQPLMVLGENVSQAAQFATTGNADGGIIAYSLARAPQVSSRSVYALIPESWHAPLDQRMVLLNGAGEVAAAFYEYMRGPQAKTILDSHGFMPPQE